MIYLKDFFMVTISETSRESSNKQVLEKYESGLWSVTNLRINKI